jgi:hypothetical protein
MKRLNLKLKPIQIFRRKAFIIVLCNGSREGGGFQVAQHKTR